MWLDRITILLGAEVPSPSLSEWGLPGAVITMVVGFAWYLLKAMTTTLDLERAENKELRAEVKRLNQEICDRFIPTLASAMTEAAKLTEVTAEATRVLQTRQEHRR